MKVNKWLIPTLALALLLGTVGIAQATGWWLVSGREMVNLEQLTGGADVKGWMTLEQVAGGIGMETAALIAKLGLPADIPPATALKDLEGVTAGFEVTTVRAVVDEVLGLAPAGGTDEAPAVAAEETPTLAAATPAPTAGPTPTTLPAPTATVAHTPAGEGAGTGAAEGETLPAGDQRPRYQGAPHAPGNCGCHRCGFGGTAGGAEAAAGHGPENGCARPGGYWPGDRGRPGAGRRGGAAMSA